MKRIILFFTFITITILISGCNIDSTPSAVTTDSTSNSISASPSESDIIYNELTYETGIYYNKDWENGHGITNNSKIIPDSDTAIAFGDIILKNYQNRGFFPNYTLEYVFYDTEDDVYILAYWHDRGIGWDTSCFNIAINCSNGEVLRMWVQ